MQVDLFVLEGAPESFDEDVLPPAAPSMLIWMPCWSKLRCPPTQARMSRLELVALLVREYDPAIQFFRDVLQFELVEDSPALTTDGRAKRWVVVRPPGSETGILLARADGELQTAAVGQQFAGRVGFFLRVADFEETYRRLQTAGVEFVRPPRDESYGRVAVFLDCEGNRWDVIGPAAGA